MLYEKLSLPKNSAISVIIPCTNLSRNRTPPWSIFSIFPSIAQVFLRILRRVNLMKLLTSNSTTLKILTLILISCINSSTMMLYFVVAVRWNESSATFIIKFQHNSVYHDIALSRYSFPGETMLAPPPEKHLTSFMSLNYFKEDMHWGELNDKLHEYDWHSVFREKDVNEMLSTFYAVCFDISLPLVSSKSAKKTVGQYKHPRYRWNLTRRRRRIHKILNTVTCEKRKTC